MDLAAARRFAAAEPSLLVPPRDVGGGAVEGASEILDVLALGEDAGIAVARAGPAYLVVPLARGRRAVAGDGVAAGALRVIGDGTPRGRFRPVRFGAVPPQADGEPPEVAIPVDQSNESTIVDGAVVLKIFPRTTAGPQPGLLLPAHLRAVGFTQIPAPVGALLWDGEDGEVLLATATSYLPGARDGWDWFVAALLGAVDGSDPWPIDAAAALGDLTGCFHAAMARPSPIFPEPVSSAAAGSWFEDALSTLDEALAATTGPDGAELRALEVRVRAALDGLDLAGETPVLPIHDDLHVGQVLRWEAGEALSDFDGNPLAPPAQRTAAGPAARDVASMARAIDHVGRIVQRQRPAHGAEVDGWIGAARDAFLVAYRAAAPRGLFDERLLVPLEVAQECHEFLYAARFLPRWREVPERAMPALLELAR